MCALAVTFQCYVDHKLRGLMQRGGAVSRIDSFGRTEIGHVLFGSREATHVEITGATVFSGLVRRRCDGKLTLGVGARVELGNVKSSFQVSARQSADLTASGGCFDAQVLEPFLGPEYSLVQGDSIHVSGLCGPDISGLEIHRGGDGELTFGVTLHDRTDCLKRLSFLAPSYPEKLIPEEVHLRWESRDVRWSKPKLEGPSAVAFVAEVSRLLEDAELSLDVSWTTAQGERVGACLSRTKEKTHSKFTVALGASEDSLAAITKPFVSADNREVLADLRTEEARCDDSSAGLVFSSDLHEVKLGGEALTRRREAHLSSPGFRRAACDERERKNCRYDIGVIQLTEQGRLARPEQLEAIVRTLESQSGVQPLVFAFLHGWRHDAAETDGNLRGFEKMVQRLAERALGDSEKVRVFGVYLSWPGRLFDSLSANKLATFWNRLATARRLGEKDGDLELILRRLSSISEGREVPARVSLVAHSMGADPLLSVVSRLEPEESPQSVLLVNPALSVARAEELGKRGFPVKTTLVSYGSLADLVTAQFFPLGGAVEFSGQTRKRLFAETTTINNSPAWIDAYLRPSEAQGGVVLCPSVDGDRCVPGSRFRPPEGKLMVVGVDEDIIDGHAEFMTEAFVEHLIDVVFQ